MADDRPQSAKESKGFRNRLKKAFGLESQSTTQSRSNSPSAIAAPPVVAERPIDAKEAAKLRAKYSRFRILVIGRANAGKTTLLKRVCNTTEDPCIYDEDKSLLEPTSKRGIHDVRREFTFKNNPQFIFHDSPGFEAGGAKELEVVMDFIQQRSKSKEVNDQIHVIWFCFELDVCRPLLPLEVKFFNEQRVGNVPVVAIFMKFDDLITQVFDRNKKPEENTKMALDILQERFEQPLRGLKFPPRAYMQFKALHEDKGDHQKQVGGLIKQTAKSIDDLALKMLFITVQQNNLEVCIEYAVNRNIFHTTKTMEDLITKTVSWFGHCCLMDYDYGEEQKYGDYVQYKYDGGVGLFVHHVCNVISAQFNMPSLPAFIAILICLEHSFWLITQGSRPTKAFTRAFDTYIKDKQSLVAQNLETYLMLKSSNDWFTWNYHPSNNECTEFQKIVLDNLLSHPKPSI